MEMTMLNIFLWSILAILIAIFLYLVFQREKPKPTGFLLKNLEVEPFKPKYINKALEYWRMQNLGKIIVMTPPDHVTKINPTMPPGGTSKIFIDLCHQLGNDDYIVQRFDEWLEVSPVHSTYYTITKKQKEDLEAKIKSGLTSAAQAVADYELIKHDLRRYQEFMEYLKEKDEHSLKAIFVDQVDYHAGATEAGPGRLSMSFMQQKNIMPTIVQDFLEMKSEEDLEKNPRLKDLPKVEKNMLKTKWRAYQVWKRMFEKEVRERYKRIKELVASRKKSIEEYRNWLKPYIARHKIMEEGFARPTVRRQFMMAFEPQAEAQSYNRIILWAWKNLVLEELYRAPGELQMKKPIRPDDRWTMRELVWDKNKGLVADYKWITPSWIRKKIKEIYDEKWMFPTELYYVFFIIDVLKKNTRYADGTEIEDTDFVFKSTLFSQNALLVKLLELKAKQEELERYIDSLLGIRPEHEDIEEFLIEGLEKIKKKEMKEKELIKKAVEEYELEEEDVKDIITHIKKKQRRGWSFGRLFLDFFFKITYESPLQVFRRGPYESNLEYRLTKYYLGALGSKLNTYKNFIKEKMGYGV